MARRRLSARLLPALLAALVLSLTGCPHGAGGEHTHHHGFADAERWAAQFEDPGRDAWQRPEVVIEALELAPRLVVADIGSATGYFPVRIAPRVPLGRVWGVDIEPDMVRYLNRRARDEGLANLFSVLGRPEDPLLPEAVDRVLVVDTYHHISERGDYFERLRAHLRPGALVVIVDFRKGELPVGPSDAMKLAPDAVIAEMEAAGYELVARDEQSLPYQYILSFAQTSG